MGTRHLTALYPNVDLDTYQGNFIFQVIQNFSSEDDKVEVSLVLNFEIIKSWKGAIKRIYASGKFNLYS